MLNAIPPSPSQNIVNAQMSKLPDNWVTFSIGEGWVALEPSRGWYQIDGLPEELIRQLPPRAGKLSSAFLPELLAANIQNMPGNGNSLPIGWFKNACAILQEDKVETKHEAAVPTERSRHQKGPDREQLRACRLDLHNALAGIYPNPEAARKSVERFLRSENTASACQAVLQKNPTRFGQAHPLHQRWWNPSLSEILSKLKEML